MESGIVRNEEETRNDGCYGLDRDLPSSFFFRAKESSANNSPVTPACWRLSTSRPSGIQLGVAMSPDTKEDTK